MATEQELMTEILAKHPPCFAPRKPRAASARTARLGLLVGLCVGSGLCLSACSKCDVPDYFHLGSPTAPHACHGDAPVQ